MSRFNWWDWELFDELIKTEAEIEIDWLGWNQDYSGGGKINLVPGLEGFLDEEQHLYSRIIRRDFMRLNDFGVHDLS